MIAIVAAAAALSALVTYALTRPAPQQQPQQQWPVANATVYFHKSIAVNYTGYWKVPLGWVETGGDVVLWLNVTVPGGEVYGVYVNGAEYGNPATVLLHRGVYTVEALVHIPRATNITVEYRVWS